MRAAIAATWSKRSVWIIIAERYVEVTVASGRESSQPVRYQERIIWVAAQAGQVNRTAQDRPFSDDLVVEYLHASGSVATSIYEGVGSGYDMRISCAANPAIIHIIVAN